MEAFRLRNIKTGAQFEDLFPRAKGTVYTVKKNASLIDTLNYIPQVVGRTLDQTKKLASHLKGKSVYETCRNIWEFVYGHIQYRKDEKGYEQIRSPARTWYDRRHGVDCDCYSVFISTVLTNLNIPHTLRITKYKENYFQHIYPIVPDGNDYITMDCVTDQFDYEVPYSKKKDYPMDLQYLDGVPNPYTDPNDIYLMGMDDDIGELGKLFKKALAKKASNLAAKSSSGKKLNIFQRIKAKAATKPPPPPSGDLPKPKKKKFLGKVLNKINKINPATVLLRNGILASMKLNVKKVAARLRWSYLTPEQAAQKGIDSEKFKRLVATRQKLENIFYGAGGKLDNLKKAILSGKGNKDKAVNGLGALSSNNGLDYMDAQTPLQHLLGTEMYYTENVDGMEGFNGLGELGEPLTLTSVAAAAGVIAGIVGALKQIGDIFKGKGKGSEDFEEEGANASPDASTDNMPADNGEQIVKPPADEASNSLPVVTKDETDESEEPTNLPASEDVDQQKLPVNTNNKAINRTNNKDAGTRTAFWEKNKDWLKPTVIVGGGIAVIAIGYGLLHKNKKHSSGPPGLSGFPNSRQKKKKHHRKKKHTRKKIAVALI